MAKGRTGTTEGLAAIGRSQGFGVEVVAPVGEKGGTFSSSGIRDHLRKGEMSEAAEQLGYWWRIQGQGRARTWPRQGARLPHAQLAARSRPRRGARHLRHAPVYHKGRRYCTAAGYVGSQPDFRAGHPGALEAYLLFCVAIFTARMSSPEFIAPLRADRAFTGGEPRLRTRCGTTARPRASSFAISERTTRCVASPWAAPSKWRHWIVREPGC